MAIRHKKIIQMLLLIMVVSFWAGLVTTEYAWLQETEKSTPIEREDGWRFLIAPYGWVMATQGDADGKQKETPNPSEYSEKSKSRGADKS